MTNGTFDSVKSPWAGGSWAWQTDGSGGGWLRNSAGSTSTTYQTGTGIAVGTKYGVTFTVGGRTAGNVTAYLGSAAGTVRSANGTYSQIITCSGDTILRITGNSTFDGYIDNVSVRLLAEEDRSVNGNGLQVFGTVTKTAVATGAELMGYSGFSSANYLMQPYNSDLDFGTGDFSIMLWFKTPDKSVAGTLFHRSSSNFGDGSWATNAVIQIEFNTSSLYGLVGTNGFSVNSGPNVPLTALSNDVWHQYAMVRRSGRIAGYIDGKFIADAANVLTTTNTTAKFYIGERPVCK